MLTSIATIDYWTAAWLKCLHQNMPRCDPSWEAFKCWTFKRQLVVMNRLIMHRLINGRTDCLQSRLSQKPVGVFFDGTIYLVSM